MARPSSVPRRVSLSLQAWPRVRVEGTMVPVGLRYGLALFAHLALTARPVARLRAASLLWPAVGDAVARTRLRRLLYAFNGAAGADLVCGDADALWIDPAVVEVDCDVRKVQQLAQALIELGAGFAMPTEVAALLAPDAHCILEGFAVDSPAFQDWIEQQRVAHQRLLAHGLQRLAERCVAEGRIALAVEASERLIALDALAERGYAVLMVALGHQGDLAAIESAYFRCAGLLRSEYGIVPSTIVETAYASASAMARQAPRVDVAAREGGVATPPAEEPAQEIRFARSSDGVKLAYASSGDGMPVIKAATWLSHLEHDRGSPIWSHLVRAMSRDFTYVRYDERGCGLSDWEVQDLSFESWLNDLDAIVESMGVERFALLGISQGASIAIAYAVRHPQRVSHLVLHGGYARGRLVRSDTPQQREEAETMAKLVELGWGKAEPSFRQFFTSQFIPDGTPEQHDWFNELERISTSPANAARFMGEFAGIDITRLLPQVRCPTLVLHSLDDVRVPAEEGRLIADAIPGARFVPIHSRNHLLLEHEAGWPHWLEEVRGFLGR